MKHTELKLLQEKTTGLFFGPVGNGPHSPQHERERAWLYDEQQVVATIRSHYGGDHGAELVNVLPCSQTEFCRWCGRRGGLVKSLKKTKANRRNARQPKQKREVVQ